MLNFHLHTKYTYFGHAMIHCLYPGLYVVNSDSFDIEAPIPADRRHLYASTTRTMVVASRLQVPLALAYAITVHKSQGMTLSYMKCNLANSFTTGQTYVGISRVRGLEGLVVEGFNSTKLNASKTVLEFYRKHGMIAFPFINEAAEKPQYDEAIKKIIERHSAVFEPSVVPQSQSSNTSHLSDAMRRRIDENRRLAQERLARKREEATAHVPGPGGFTGSRVYPPTPASDPVARLNEESRNMNNETINCLSTSDLRKRLIALKVDISRCIEKSELVALLRSQCIQKKCEEDDDFEILPVKSIAELIEER